MTVYSDDISPRTSKVTDSVKCYVRYDYVNYDYQYYDYQSMKMCVFLVILA